PSSFRWRSSPTRAWRSASPTGGCRDSSPRSSRRSSGAATRARGSPRTSSSPSWRCAEPWRTAGPRSRSPWSSWHSCRPRPRDARGRGSVPAPRARKSSARITGHEVPLPRLRRADEAPLDRGPRRGIADRCVPVSRVRIPRGDADQPVRDADGEEPRRAGRRPDHAGGAVRASSELDGQHGPRRLRGRDRGRHGRPGLPVRRDGQRGHGAGARPVDPGSRGARRAHPGIHPADGPARDRAVRRGAWVRVHHRSGDGRGALDLRHLTPMTKSDLVVRMATAAGWPKASTALAALLVPAAAVAQDARLPSSNSRPASVSAGAVLLLDAYGRPLFAKNADDERAPASLVKLMTLYLANEDIERGKAELDEPVQISHYAALTPKYRMGLRAGEWVPLHVLLEGVAIASANDAATALAERLAGDESVFVERMNAKARELGLA